MFKKIWKALDNNKTTIGIVAWLASDYAGVLGIPVKIFAVLVGGPGIIHKGAKIVKSIKNGEK